MGQAMLLQAWVQVAYVDSLHSLDEHGPLASVHDLILQDRMPNNFHRTAWHPASGSSAGKAGSVTWHGF